MDAVKTFLAMGGYAVYVWPAIAATVVIMIWIVVASLKSLRARERRLALLSEARARRTEGTET